MLNHREMATHFMHRFPTIQSTTNSQHSVKKTKRQFYLPKKGSTATVSVAIASATPIEFVKRAEEEIERNRNHDDDEDDGQR